MRIDNEFEVAAPVDQVWMYLLDVPRMAPCLPGAELTEVVDDNTYKGRVITKLGPVSMQFAGTAHIVSKDEAARKVVLNAEGAEEKGKGQASLAVTATLVRVGKGTKVLVSQDVEIAGAAAQFGRGMVADVAAVLMKTFAENVAEDIPRWQRGEQRIAPTAPAKGFSIWWQATAAALQRFFVRMFGRSR
ncbi:carbon monoxide dehydrogenase subunit G [Kibdelosporangium banguiense]|uniref:Carbon monoxide dehydrogenase subunit G n=1 Tax=Kibdelosporangium banguiense TaxID=1365924 RepID=A0ABS4TL05_9PSEU|nr:SRPBCC family protein [Kibdelosporangium banguiense]MBP2325112.1 carbon monoxide dehydrogenase subunit G [Kibdelosporangium banguiense]